MPLITPPHPEREIRAVYDDQTIRVYQAYSHTIADAALRNGTFVSPPFSMSRMTWVKPSFLWMMYRAGWGKKDAGQERILAIDITRAGFYWALLNSCPSHPQGDMTEETWRQRMERSPVRIQWDPERDLLLRPLEHRSIQIGLGPEAVQCYVGEWITQITDITMLAHEIHSYVQCADLERAASLLPIEKRVDLPHELEVQANCEPGDRTSG